MRLLAKAPYKTVEFEGWQILIGRSSADNDILSLQVARPEDTWLHVAEYPGSHVVIRNPERKELPENVLEEAGRLAIQNSKAKGLSGVEVVVGLAGDLYKPKGAAVGQINLDKYYTRKVGAQNTKVVVSVQEDSEAENRGWQVDRFSALLEGEEVGYLKVAFIPKERMQQFYPSVWGYISRIKGTRVDETSVKSKWEYLAQQILPWSEYCDKSRSLTLEQMQQNIDKWVRHSKMKQIIQEFEAFKSYHTNKPVVDFIRVRPENMRQGVAVALYVFAAKHYGKKGMKLYASGLQQPAAKAAWDWMKQNDYPVNAEAVGKSHYGPARLRYYMDYR